MERHQSLLDGMTPERSGHKILIVASDAILAALVGTLVEFARYTAAFPAPDESPTQALMRVKPLVAVLLDVSDQNGATDVFVSRAQRQSVPVLLFGARSLLAERTEWVARHQLGVFALPEEIARLENAIERIIPDAVRPRAVRDRRGEAQRSKTGTLDFTDARGVHWTVYDRRGPERRNRVDRRFVSDSGEVLHCEITEQEARLISVATLAEQLTRAIPE
jgi:hypothetical protein